MQLEALLESLKRNPEFMQNVSYWHTQEATEGHYADFPAQLDENIVKALHKRGIYRLYTHQRQALDLALSGKNVTVVTPTASGKTYCYNLPVLNEIAKNEDIRALYLFPTKALAADQVAELYEMIQDTGHPIKAFTYDGDTPSTARSKVRQAGQIVVTNPDMLHSGILPHHTKWIRLFENLRYVVIDEIHAYRGIFGSNLSNVLTRLKRICAFYGSNPQFICCSATIRNPQELAEKLTGEKMEIVDKNGAPHGASHFVFVNPPLINKQLGLRKSSLTQTRQIADLLIRNQIQTIVFAKSRLNVEVLTTYLKRLVTNALGDADTVRGYRSGYLPTLRREIEQGLRQGKIMGVVSTNALELGIDIGALEACVLCGYPGTVASARQQAGRAGRRGSASVTFLVASSAPIDQFMMKNPQYLLDASPENALVNPNNLYILMNHIKCAAYELPFRAGENFGSSDGAAPMLEYLCEENILRKSGNRFFWSAEEFPASEISLRSADDENFTIVDITNAGHHRVIGEMDRFTVPMLLHEHAIYIHEADQYQVEKLDFDDKKAYVRSVNVDYYTDADLNTSLRVLDILKEKEGEKISKYEGEVLVSSIVTMFKKIKFDTHENLGFGRVNLPELEMHTTSAWFTLSPSLMEGLGSEDAQNGMQGIAQLLRTLSPLYLMCASQDICVTYHVKDPFSDLPTLFLYDTIPGGMGLSERVYEIFPLLLSQALQIVKGCSCESGCPACTNPLEGKGKETAITLLERMIAP